MNKFAGFQSVIECYTAASNHVNCAHMQFDCPAGVSILQQLCIVGVCLCCLLEIRLRQFSDGWCVVLSNLAGILTRLLSLQLGHLSVTSSSALLE